MFKLKYHLNRPTGDLNSDQNSRAAATRKTLSRCCGMLREPVPVRIVSRAGYRRIVDYSRRSDGNGCQATRHPFVNLRMTIGEGETTGAFMGGCRHVRKTASLAVGFQISVLK